MEFDLLYTYFSELGWKVHQIFVEFNLLLIQMVDKTNNKTKWNQTFGLFTLRVGTYLILSNNVVCVYR